jgi:hypothetical protein
MVPVCFLPTAAAELKEAQDWYDAHVEGLGGRFFAAVDALLPRIGDSPGNSLSPMRTCAGHW